MGLGRAVEYRGTPTVEYRARNHSPAPLSPLAVSSQQGEVVGSRVREVPIHLLDKIELISEQLNSSSSSDSNDSPPRNNRLPG